MSALAVARDALLRIGSLAHEGIPPSKFGDRMAEIMMLAREARRVVDDAIRELAAASVEAAPAEPLGAEASVLVAAVLTRVGGRASFTAREMAHAAGLHVELRSDGHVLHISTVAA